MRRIIPYLAKAAVSGLLLYFALRFVHFDTLAQRLSRLDWTWLVAGLFALGIQLVLVARRWSVIAHACGAELTAQNSLRYILIGAFFNQTLPSTVGGDAARIWLMARTEAGWKSAIHSVLIDRAAGLIWLSLLVLACLPWSFALIQNPVGRTALIVIGAASIGALAGLFLVGEVGGAWLRHWRPTRYLAEIALISWRVLASPRSGGEVALLSIGIHLLTVMAGWSAAQAVGAPLDPLNALLLIPPVILVSAIPVSIAGWGVREGALIAAFAYAGLPQSEGLLVSLLLGAGMFVTGVFGGLAWIASSQRTRIVPLPD